MGICRTVAGPGAAIAPAKDPGRAALETGYAGLDLIRFSAALMIAFYHLINIGPARVGEAGAAFRADFAAVHPYTAAFWVAVPIFFTLSGVVIAFSAEGRTAGEFVRRRALRLYPAAWICASVTALIVWAKWPQPDLLARYVRSITLFPSGPWISDVYWTMAVEVTFYAMMAAALALGGSRWIVRLGGMLALVSSAWWGLRLGNWFAGNVFEPWLDRLQVADAFLLLRNGCFFAVGILLYALASGRRSFLIVLLATLSVLASVASVLSSARGFLGPGRDGLSHLLLPPFIWIAGLGVIIASLIYERSARGRSFRWRAGMRSVGLATYPLYLVHAELGMAVMLLLAPLGSVTALAMTLLILLGAVALILRGEAIVRRLLHRMTEPRPAVGVTRPGIR